MLFQSMKIYPDIIQGSAEWLEIRKGCPTASNFDRILTAKGARSTQIDGYIRELIAECFVPEFVEFTGNKATEWGKSMEPVAREAFIKRTGHEVREVGFIATDDKTAGCSPDGLIVCDGEFVGGLEIKCPYSPKTHIGYILDGVLPEEYRQQVHGSLTVSGLPVWHFWSYYPGLNPFHIEVRPDSYTRAMAAALREFTKMYTDAWRFAEPKLTPK